MLTTKVTKNQPDKTSSDAGYIGTMLFDIIKAPRRTSKDKRTGAERVVMLARLIYKYFESVYFMMVWCVVDPPAVVSL